MSNDDSDFNENDDIEELVRKLGLVDETNDETNDYEPDEDNPGIPKMFLKDVPKASIEREERYENEIKSEKTVNSKQFTFLRLLYENIPDKRRKQMNKLLRITTGENFVTAQKSDITYIALDPKSNVVGYTMVSNYSPENHFKVEGPYLYNFITDTSLKKEKRCGHSLLAFVEKDLNESGAKLINLDVEHGNVRAFKFFMSNKYRVIGKYEKLDLKNMNLYEVDKTINKFKLSDKIKEIKERRGLSTKENSTIILDDSNEVSNKKIKYISLTKRLV